MKISMTSTFTIVIMVVMAKMVKTAMYDSFHNYDSRNSYDRGFTLLVKGSISTREELLSRVYNIKLGWTDIQVFIKFLNFY